jgi:hypothetical protein
MANDGTKDQAATAAQAPHPGRRALGKPADTWKVSGEAR